MKQNQAQMREALARLTLRSLSHPLFSRLSWNRVRVCLLNFERCEAYFIEDTLIVDFLFHRHSVSLHPNGRGFLTDPWDESAPKYKLVMPSDIQLMVKELHNAYKAPIPINMDLN